MSKYVKFIYECACAEIAPFDKFAELNHCRQKLLELGVIGVDSTGISFGNLSVRDGATKNFHITGAATGGLPELSPTDCVRDRLSWFLLYNTNPDFSALDQALAVANRHKIDLEKIRDWAKSEGEIERLAYFEQRLSVAR